MGGGLVGGLLGCWMLDVGCWWWLVECWMPVGVGVFSCWLGFRGWGWLIGFGLDVGCWMLGMFEF